MTPTQGVIVDGYLAPCDAEIGAVAARLDRGRSNLPLNGQAAAEVERATELLGEARACLTAARHRTLGV